jgi:CRP-like cAMP-binding protein
MAITSPADTASPGNRILQALPEEEREGLTADLQLVALPTMTVIFEPGEAIQWVYFPLDGVISLVTPLADGDAVEVATIGNEGIVGVPAAVGGSLVVRALSSVGGHALRIDAVQFTGDLGRFPGLQRLVRRYVQALFGQIAQAAACNRLHSNEERLSRWLLMTRDRMGSDSFPVTHEFLAQMIGSRRATVTLSAGSLQSAGLIHYHRGQVTIVDRPGLEAVACECHGVIRAALDEVVASPMEPG